MGKAKTNKNNIMILIWDFTLTLLWISSVFAVAIILRTQQKWWESFQYVINGDCNKKTSNHACVWNSEIDQSSFFFFLRPSPSKNFGNVKIKSWLRRTILMWATGTPWYDSSIVALFHIHRAQFIPYWESAEQWLQRRPYYQGIAKGCESHWAWSMAV